MTRLHAVRVYQWTSDPQAVDGEADGFEFRWLTTDEVRTAASRDAKFMRPFLAARIDAGLSCCRGAFDVRTGKLAAFVWLAGSEFPPEWIFGPHVRIPADTIYVYNAVTAVEYRGRRLFGRLLVDVYEQESVRQRTRMFLTVEFANNASHNAISVAGPTDLGLHVCVGMPFGFVLKASRLALPIAERPKSIRAEDDVSLD